MKKWVYLFNTEVTEGSKQDRNLLGGKGANLAEMAILGLNVPSGLTISTEACIEFYNYNKELPADIWQQTLEGVKKIEGHTQKTFGGTTSPLLFSVRSGARVSMPGMMDTVLNLGLNDETVKALAIESGDERFAYDSYRRFIQMYSNVVLGMKGHLLESLLEDLKEARSLQDDTALSSADLQELVGIYKETILQELGHTFPQDPYKQLENAVKAVFNSWNNSRAIKYREMNHFRHDWGTAVNIQMMVFGNLGSDCATGVAFTRDPSTGDKRFFGEYLVNAQGEDVVAGIRTPNPINSLSKNESNKNLKTLEEVMPRVYKELCTVYQKLEHHYRDMQDIEFTIERGKLYLLQTRNGKRTTKAALKIALAMHKENLITKEEAVLRIDPEELNQLLHPQFDPKSSKTLLGTALPASPGAAVGRMALTSAEAQKMSSEGSKVILVRQETCPDDIHGMAASQGILTARGGMTSHAAVVARGMGKPCVAGLSGLFIEMSTKTVRFGSSTFKEGDFISLDGALGHIYEGEVSLMEASLNEDFTTFMKMVDEIRTVKVRTNADNEVDAKMALRFGAEGIGLCRTEHMFFDPERVLAVREMIFAHHQEGRRQALAKILPFQQSDFQQLFSVMEGLPVNIRLLDPPLHEFLPYSLQEKEELASYLKIDLGAVEERIKSLHEFNPM